MPWSNSTRRSCYARRVSARAFGSPLGLELAGATGVVEPVRRHRLRRGLHPAGVELLPMLGHRGFHLCRRCHAPRLAATVDLAFELNGCHAVHGSCAVPSCPGYFVCMTVAEARERLLDLIEQYGGYVGVAIIEADGQLAANREVVSAAVHELVTEPEITAGDETDIPPHWFPCSFLSASAES
jgi:hypothetical protein